MSGKLCIYHEGTGDNSMFFLDGNNPEKMRQVSLPEGWKAELENGKMMAFSKKLGMKWNIEDCLHSEKGDPILMGPEGEVVSLKYTMDSFAKEIVSSLKNYLPSELQGREVQIRNVSKTNRPQLHSLVLQSKSASLPAAEPSIYLEDFYPGYKKGLSMDEILMDIAREETTLYSAPDLEFQKMAEEVIQNAFNWDYMKDRVVISAVGADLNREMLRDIPHQTIGDIAGIYRIYVGESSSGAGFITVTDQMMERWGITQDELNEAALSNSAAVQPARLGSMFEVLNDMTNGELPDDPSISSTLYVLTNKQKMHGAGVLFYPGIQDKISAVFPDGCYILPSSIHEVLLVQKENMDPEDLMEMVRAVNDTTVSREDLLSYKVHEYDPATRTIGLAGQVNDLTRSTEVEMEVSRKL